MHRNWATRSSTFTSPHPTTSSRSTTLPAAITNTWTAPWRKWDPGVRRRRCRRGTRPSTGCGTPVQVRSRWRSSADGRGAAALGRFCDIAAKGESLGDWAGVHGWRHDVCRATRYGVVWIGRHRVDLRRLHRRPAVSGAAWRQPEHEADRRVLQCSSHHDTPRIVAGCNWVGILRADRCFDHYTDVADQVGAARIGESPADRRYLRGDRHRLAADRYRLRRVSPRPRSRGDPGDQRFGVAAAGHPDRALFPPGDPDRCGNLDG